MIGIKAILTKILTELKNLQNTIQYDNGSTVALANATWKTVASTTLPPGGYLLVGTGRFPTNATGVRSLRFSEDKDSNDEVNRLASVTLPASSGVTSIIQVVFPYYNTGSLSKTIYLNAYQSSGGNLNCNTPSIGVVKLY